MEEHFEKSVLSKLPDRYKSSLKQSVISEEDDMGNSFIFVQIVFGLFLGFPKLLFEVFYGCIALEA